MLEVNSTDDGKLSVLAPAKLNLCLSVLGKRPDGYHDIESLVVAVDLYDRLDAQEAPEVSLTCEGETVPGGEENLVMRAASALREATACSRGARISLCKSIPVGRGLGGGSSDAAATLVLLNELWKCGLNRRELAEISARLGSDVPLFLSSPVSIIRGRGERIEPLPVACLWHFVVLSPSFGLSTAEVYNAVRFPLTAVGQNVNLMYNLLPDGSVVVAGEHLYNSLSESAFRLRPELPDLIDMLKQFGAQAAGLTGSGSAVFAIAQSRDEAVALSRRIDKRGVGQVFVVTGL